MHYIPYAKAGSILRSLSNQGRTLSGPAVGDHLNNVRVREIDLVPKIKKKQTGSVWPCAWGLRRPYAVVYLAGVKKILKLLGCDVLIDNC